MKKTAIFLINIIVLLAWLTMCLRIDPKLEGEWHLYIWTAFFAIFSFLDQFHWQSQDLASALHHDMEGTEQNSIRTKHQIRKTKAQLRRILHWSWGFKLVLVLSVGIFQFVDLPWWPVKYAVFGLSYGLVLGFLNISFFLWSYYLIFDHLSERYSDNLEAAKRREEALQSLMNK